MAALTLASTGLLACGDDDDDGLSCEATVADGGLNAVEVSCTGSTEEGQDATMTGRTDEMPGASVTELEGQFTGTAGGDEVFAVQQLGG
jgi:hypothetical protein